MSVPTLSASDFGVKADGSTDDTAAWNSALSTLKVAGGGILLAPVGTSVITQTLELDFNGAKIIGMGRGAYHDQSSPASIGPAASTLLWKGAGDGVVVQVQPASSATSGITDWAVVGVHLDSGYFTTGTAAGTGLLIASASHGHADVFCEEFTVQGMLVTTAVGISESGNSAYNRIEFRGRQINTPGVLIRLNGYNGTTNSCFNRIARIAGEFSGSIGLDLHDCDNNTFEEVYLQSTSSGSAVVFNGGDSPGTGPGAARNNTIEHLSTSINSAQILAIGTDGGDAVPSGPNRIEQYDEGNATPNVAIGTGARLYFGTNATPPGLQAFSSPSDSQFGGYRTTEDGFSFLWGSTGELAAGSSNAISFPAGLFRNYVTFATATPLGSVANNWAINGLDTTGMSIVVGGESAYFLWRAEGY